MGDKRRVNIYGWTDTQQQQLEQVYDRLRAKGLPFERDGKPNVSAILLYLLEQEARKS